LAVVEEWGWGRVFLCVGYKMVWWRV